MDFDKDFYTHGKLHLISKLFLIGNRFYYKTFFTNYDKPTVQKKPLDHRSLALATGDSEHSSLIQTPTTQSYMPKTAILSVSDMKLKGFVHSPYSTLKVYSAAVFSKFAAVLTQSTL